MARPLKDLTGQRSFRLLAIEYDRGRKKWLCRCDCGELKHLRGSQFRKTKSCGCWVTDMLVQRNRKHGDCTRAGMAPEYRAYMGAIKRCDDKSHRSYRYYGGRGISVCDRWRNGKDGRSGYECFLEDMGRKPSPKHSIDRIDNDKHYEPGNCRWATLTEQMRNRRDRRTIEFRGKKFCVSAAAELVGLDRDLVLERLNRGWSPESALTTPKLELFGGTGAKRFSHSDAGRALVATRQSFD